MHTKMQFNALMACVLLVIPAAAFADNGSQQSTASAEYSYLNAMLARATCQTNYVTGTISTAISDIPNINQTAISADSTKLLSDLQTLTTDVSSENKTKFRTDLQLFKSDSKTATLDLRSAIKKANPTDDEKAKLKSDLTDLQKKWKSCMFSAGQQFANTRIQAYGTGIQKVQNRTNTLESKEVDTTRLKDLTNQAQTNLGSLAVSIASATNSSELKSALKGYCQYNGCRNGTNFHFAAQSALVAEQSTLDKIKLNPNSGQYSSQIDKAQTDLTNAQNILNAVDTNQYKETQKTDVWNSLHDAHGVIKQLWIELNGKSKRSSSS